MKEFSYKLLAGPFETLKELLGVWNEGNCRRALQYYFFIKHDLFLSQNQVLLPDAYHKTGDFVFKKYEKVDYSKLKIGDVIYAENILNKRGEPIDKSEKIFVNEDEYLKYLHSAIYVGDEKIWHSTAVVGGSCEWSIQYFNKYYKIIAVKRIIR